MPLESPLVKSASCGWPGTTLQRLEVGRASSKVVRHTLRGCTSCARTAQVAVSGRCIPPQLARRACSPCQGFSGWGSAHPPSRPPGRRILSLSSTATRSSLSAPRATILSAHGAERTRRALLHPMAAPHANVALLVGPVRSPHRAFWMDRLDSQRGFGEVVRIRSECGRIGFRFCVPLRL